VKPVNLQDVLTALREQISAPRNAYCLSCGSTLVYVNGRLSICEIDESPVVVERLNFSFSVRNRAAYFGNVPRFRHVEFDFNLPAQVLRYT